MKLSEKLLQEIAQKHLEPTPKLYFKILRYLWFLAMLLSIILGSQALGLSLESVLDEGGPMRGRGFLIIASSWIPWMWFLSATLLLAVAYFSVRQFRFGYRYQTLLLIIVLGTLIVGLGFVSAEHRLSFKVHRILMHNFSPYTELFNQERIKLWNQPSEGRLYGRIVSIQDVHHVQILSADQKLIHIKSKENLHFKAGDEIRILGQKCDTAFCAEKIQLGNKSGSVGCESGKGFSNPPKSNQQ